MVAENFKDIETKDMFGQVVKVGDIIAYPVRQSSWMQMRVAVVTALHYKLQRDEKNWRTWDVNEEWASIITLVDGVWDTLTKQYFPKEKKTRFTSFARAVVIDKNMLVNTQRKMWQQCLIEVQERVRSE